MYRETFALAACLVLSETASFIKCVDWYGSLLTEQLVAGVISWLHHEDFHAQEVWAISQQLQKSCFFWSQWFFEVGLVFCAYYMSALQTEGFEQVFQKL